jgi:glycosyltransferase involved in cell wall biosynthesis
MTDVNYTIIIPHKDIPNLLQRCLDSIPIQRDDIQVIIVDDNSNPDIVDFDRFPGLGQPNTEVYLTKEGKGAGYARNVGLKHAKGKWLIFADADDFFMPCFNDTLDLYKDDENDIIYFKVTSVDSKTLKPHTRHEQRNYSLDKIQQTNNWKHSIRLSEAWGKFIKHSIIKQNNIFFQEVKYSNDVFFSVKLATTDNTKQIVSNQTIYCITYRNGSLTTFKTHESQDIRFQVHYNTYICLKGIGKERCLIESLCRTWKHIFTSDYKTAISLFPKVIEACGFRKFFMGMILIAYLKMEREINKSINQ